ELQLRNKEIESRAAVAMAKPGKTETPPSMLDQAKEMADIDKTRAETDQIVVETEIMIGQATAPAQPQQVNNYG
ncbi:hypothetical protein NYY71_19130, partial [Acinetobacter baumannii]|nr:hypothetical protein [Acinetobacter baumannii]